jgi:hypothetical protein
MAGEDPPTEELKLRQLAQEHAEREQLADAENEAEAERHRRRADKAGYLRQKLEERERSEREAGDDLSRTGGPAWSSPPVRRVQTPRDCHRICESGH